MWTVQSQQLNVSVEMLFPKAVPFRMAQIELFAENALERFREYGLAPLQIFQRDGNGLFDYDISFWLFNGNGLFRLTAEKLFVQIQNARSPNDLSIIKACLLKAVECLPKTEVRDNLVAVTNQSTFASKEERDKFLGQFADTKRGITYGGVVYYERIEAALNEFRFQIDRSAVYPEGIFLSWNGVVKAKLTEQTLDSLSNNLRSICARFELGSP